MYYLHVGGWKALTLPQQRSYVMIYCSLDSVAMILEKSFGYLTPISSLLAFLRLFELEVSRISARSAPDIFVSDSNEPYSNQEKSHDLHSPVAPEYA
jgi:hypothetical protein